MERRIRRISREHQDDNPVQGLRSLSAIYEGRAGIGIRQPRRRNLHQRAIPENTSHGHGNDRALFGEPLQLEASVRTGYRRRKALGAHIAHLSAVDRLIISGKDHYAAGIGGQDLLALSNAGCEANAGDKRR